MPLLFQACVVTRDNIIETLRPAEISLEQKKNIAICAPANLLSEAISSNEGTSRVSTDSLIYNIMYSLEKLWQEAPGFDGSNFSVFLLNSNATEKPPGFDLTVRLDKLQVKNTFYGEQYNYAAWEAFLYVHYLAKWVITDKNGQAVDEHFDRDLVVWPTGIYSSQSEAVLNLPDIADAWWDMGIAIAKSYAGRVTPQWKSETRRIFMINKFPELSAQAYSAMQNNGYARAFNIWEEMLLACRKNGQKRTKSQIAYNMAVACEFEDKLEDALYWIQRSLNYASYSANANYIQLLNKRKKERLLLDQQINR